MGDKGSPSPAQDLYEVIQSMARGGFVFDGDGDPDSGILKSYICIADFIGTDGDRWLATVRWGMDGREPPTWELVGLLETVAHDFKHHWASSDDGK